MMLRATDVLHAATSEGVRFRDADLQEEFDRTGYVVQRILDDDQLAEARAALDRAAEGRCFERNDCEDSYYNSMFEREPGFQRRFRTEMDVIFRPAVERLLSGTRLFETSLLYKPGQSRELLLHQHGPLTEQPFATSVFCWCPLTDCDERTGALMVVPGSHLILRYLRTLATGEFFEEYRGELTRRHAVPVRLKAGEAVLFENSLLHGAFPNFASSPRPVVLSIVLHEAAIHCVYKRDKTGIVAIDDGFDEIQCQTMVPNGPERISGRRVRHFPRWEAKPSLEELEALLRMGQRASEDFDPLATLRAKREVPLWQRLAGALWPRERA